MRKILIVLIFALVASYAHSGSITCRRSDGNITMTKDQATYQSGEGLLGPFERISDSVFHYTKPHLNLDYFITIAPHGGSAVLTGVYKFGGDILLEQEFSCP